MSIYDSVEEYASKLNMTMEQAQIRIDYFLKTKEEMKQSRKCPKCGQLSLAVEGGEWESGVSDWVYCENDKVETQNEKGEKHLTECDFTDSVENKYIFAFEHDFDAVLAMSCGLDITDHYAVMNYIGSTWAEFVESDTARLATY